MNDSDPLVLAPFCISKLGSTKKLRKNNKTSALQMGIRKIIEVKVSVQLFLPETRLRNPGKVSSHQEKSKL